ncbi:unnamed protein product [Boreogadus saida]
MLNGSGARRTKRPSHVRPPTPTSKWYHLTSSTSHVGLLTLTYPRYYLTPTTSHVGLLTLTYPCGIISPPPLWGLAPNVYYLER